MGFMHRVLFDRRVLMLTTKYVYDVLEVFKARELYIPEQHMYPEVDADT